MRRKSLIYKKEIYKYTKYNPINMKTHNDNIKYTY